MLPFQRPQAHRDLIDNWQHWTVLFIRRKRNNAGAAFYWPSVAGTPVNQRLIPILLDASQYHCAYCDKYPLFQSDKTIDHFIPKSKFPHFAYRWENLFPACDSCQTEKMESYKDQLLKPDNLRYLFDSYFIVDFTTFDLLPHPSLKKFDRKRAITTINILNLNCDAHKIQRRHEYTRWIYEVNCDLDDFGYRYLFL